jgi:hypothetical protein
VCTPHEDCGTSQMKKMKTLALDRIDLDELRLRDR